MCVCMRYASLLAFKRFRHIWRIALPPPTRRIHAVWLAFFFPFFFDSVVGFFFFFLIHGLFFFFYKFILFINIISFS